MARTFILTMVPMSRETRRRIGKSFTDIVEIPEPTTPLAIEQAYEALHNGPSSNRVVKVIDVRPASNGPTR